ncbi:MAG: baseplate J/gp47 family protein [Chloroflexi bacterium]|nr:baseplate J/gp47 family protein [Chloroflexota bacterium]
MAATEVIYLHHLDTLGSLRSTLETCPAKSQVWLVAPFDMPAIDNLVNLKLLKRAADTAAVDLRLVSKRSQVRILAREAGIAAYWALPQAVKPAHQRTSSGPLETRRVNLPETIRQYPQKQASGPSAAVLTLISTFIVLVLVIISIGLFMPGAKVILRPVTTLAEARFQVVADTRYHTVDYDQMIIPAHTVEVVIDGRGDTPASGRLDITDAKAEGEVVFSNKTSEAVIVPKGTIVRSGVGTPVRFVTLNDVELPAQQYGTARVGIMAVDAGPVGNVGALTINQIEGSLASRVDVLNDAPTEGGTVKRVATIAYGDFDRLSSDLSSKLQQEAFDQLVAGLSEGEFIPPSTVKVQIISQQTDQIVDQQADMLSMTMKLQVRGLVVDGAALQQLASRILEKQATADSEIIASSLQAAPSGEMLMEGDTLTFGVLATGKLGPKIDTDRVKQMAKGLTPEEAGGKLNQEYDLASSPEVVIEPDWWPYLPWMAQRIQVSILADGQ